MTALTIDQVLSAQDKKHEGVPCPEWGGTVYMRGLGGDERDAFDESTTSKKSVVGIRARLVAACWADEHGKPCAVTEYQVLELGKKSAAPLDRCFEVAQRLCGMSNRDVEELEKNLPEAESEGTG